METTPSVTGNVSNLVDHLFRHESGKMVSVLTRLFGIHNIELAEDVVQETMLKALREWGMKSVPPNPAAWLYRVAKNGAIDIIRRQKHTTHFADDLESRLSSEWTLTGTVDTLFLESEIKDSQLRMMFACCHPALPPESQIALILKTLCGFNSREIAKALLANEETINKRLYRAKQKARLETITLEIPVGAALLPRLGAVYRAIYLLFNEGYSSESEDDVIRRDLCEEAIRLALLLADNPVCDLPITHALIALICFHTARFDARVNEAGDIVLLQDQDRTKWHNGLINLGFDHFSRAMDGEQISEYHLEAAIAAEHCRAASAEETNWQLILELYEMLIQYKPSPVIALNRAIVLGKIHGPERAIQEIEQIDSGGALKSYYLLQATFGELYLQMGQYEQARTYLTAALEQTVSNPEKRLIQQKLEQCNMTAS